MTDKPLRSSDVMDAFKILVPWGCAPRRLLGGKDFGALAINTEPARPRCWNRPEHTDPNAGWKDTGAIDARPVISRRYFEHPLLKPPIVWKKVLRYRWPFFQDRCESWSAPNIEHSVPAREGWNCEGCRWLPVHAAKYLQQHGEQQ